MVQTLSKFYLVLLIVVISTFPDQTSAQVVGGWNPLETDSPHAKEAALVALKLYPDSKTWGYPQHLIEVLEAKTQVVAGLKYDLLVKMGVGACSSPEGAQDISHHDQDCYFEKVGICRFVVFRNLSGVHEIKSVDCQDFVSAWKTVALNDRVVEEATAVALRYLRKGDTKQNAHLYRMDQAFRNAITPHVYQIYSRISFNCSTCQKQSESRTLFTVKTDSKKHVMTRCEVDNSVVADNSACTLIFAFPY